MSIEASNHAVSEVVYSIGAAGAHVVILMWGKPDGLVVRGGADARMR